MDMIVLLVAAVIVVAVLIGAHRDAAAPARTVADLDRKIDDREMRLFLDALRAVPAPPAGPERRMVDRLRADLSRALDDVVLADQPMPNRCRFDLLWRSVAVEVKAGPLSAAEVQRAVGQIRQYARAWTGPLLLVLLSSDTRLDAVLRVELADLRQREGGPVVAVWKSPTAFRVVA